MCVVGTVQDVSQLELLRELFKLQKELVILLLSLLEGNECFLVIGKQMVDTLEESESHLEVSCEPNGCDIDLLSYLLLGDPSLL